MWLLVFAVVELLDSRFVFLESGFVIVPNGFRFGLFLLAIVACVFSGIVIVMFPVFAVVAFVLTFLFPRVVVVLLVGICVLTLAVKLGFGVFIGDPWFMRPLVFAVEALLDPRVLFLGSGFVMVPSSLGFLLDPRFVFLGSGSVVFPFFLGSVVVLFFFYSLFLVSEHFLIFPNIWKDNCCD